MEWVSIGAEAVAAEALRRDDDDRAKCCGNFVDFVCMYLYVLCSNSSVGRVGCRAEAERLAQVFRLQDLDLDRCCCCTKWMIIELVVIGGIRLAG